MNNRHKKKKKKKDEFTGMSYKWLEDVTENGDIKSKYTTKRLKIAPQLVAASAIDDEK